MAISGNFIVISSSANAAPALQRMVASLPVELNAAVCIVMHIPTHTPTQLDEILHRSTALPVAQASDGQYSVRVEIVVRPSDHHLLIEGTRARLTHGLRGHRTRPLNDGLFRTAVQSDGPRTISVVRTVTPASSPFHRSPSESAPLNSQ